MICNSILKNWCRCFFEMGEKPFKYLFQLFTITPIGILLCEKKYVNEEGLSRGKLEVFVIVVILFICGNRTIVRKSC